MEAIPVLDRKEARTRFVAACVAELGRYFPDLVSATQAKVRKGDTPIQLALAITLTGTKHDYDPMVTDLIAASVYVVAALEARRIRDDKLANRD